MDRAIRDYVGVFFTPRVQICQIIVFVANRTGLIVLAAEFVAVGDAILWIDWWRRLHKALFFIWGQRVTVFALYASLIVSENLAIVDRILPCADGRVHDQVEVLLSPKLEFGEKHLIE